jgi:hypothetical protein
MLPSTNQLQEAGGENGEVDAEGNGSRVRFPRTPLEWTASVALCKFCSSAIWRWSSGVVAASCGRCIPWLCEKEAYFFTYTAQVLHARAGASTSEGGGGALPTSAEIMMAPSPWRRRLTQMGGAGQRINPVVGHAPMRGLFFVKPPQSTTAAWLLAALTSRNLFVHRGCAHG